MPGLHQGGVDGYESPQSQKEARRQKQEVRINLERFYSVSCIPFVSFVFLCFL
jgi:hypothetical protein